MDRLGSAEILLFEGFRLDRPGGGLFRLGQAGLLEPVALSSRALDLLELLAERQGELVSKDAIMGAVWPGMVVEEGNLTVQISTLRRILDQSRQQGSCIQTVPGRGYRLVVPVKRVESAAPPLPLPDKPSIAVLPFVNMSGDPEQEYFADGMVEEIITALSRIHWLFVIARNSSLTYKGQAIDVKQVGRELGVHYVLEGSVRKAGGRVRITAQLIDALSGAHMWVDRFDSPLDDIFELQDKVASSVAGVIEPALRAAEIRRSARWPTHDLTAYDFYLRALPNRAAYDKDHTTRALDLLRHAIERDPRYGPALALAAECHHFLLANDWSGNQEASRREGLGLARQAIQCADDDPGVLGKAAFVLGFFGENIDAAIALMDRSLALNPSFAEGWYDSGVLRNFAGQPDLAITHLETSLRLSPRDRRARHLTGIGISHFLSRRFDDAAAKLAVSLEEIPTWVVTYRFLASCYAHLGRLDQAREIVKRLRTITPVVVPSVVPYRNPEHHELLLSGLRLAIGERE